MIVTILKDYRNLKSGHTISFESHKPNFIMGVNGSGKSTLLNCIYTSLCKIRPSLDEECMWPVQDLTQDRDSSIVKIDGFEHITRVKFSSPKLRQALLSDASVSIGRGLDRVWASDGEDAIYDVNLSYKFKDDPNCLHIFDETDSHMDVRVKKAFYRNFLPTLKGTSIIVTHDPLYILDETIYDLDTYKYRTGRSYLESK